MTARTLHVVGVCLNRIGTVVISETETPNGSYVATNAYGAMTLPLPDVSLG